MKASDIPAAQTAKKKPSRVASPLPGQTVIPGLSKTRTRNPRPTLPLGQEHSPPNPANLAPLPPSQPKERVDPAATLQPTSGGQGRLSSNIMELRAKYGLKES